MQRVSDHRPSKPRPRAPDRTDIDFQWPPPPDDGQIIWLVDAPPLQWTEPPAGSRDIEEERPTAAPPREINLRPRRVSAEPLVRDELILNPIPAPAISEVRADSIASRNLPSPEQESVPSYVSIGGRSSWNPYAFAVALSLICAAFVGSYELSDAVMRGRRASSLPTVQSPLSQNRIAIASPPVSPPISPQIAAPPKRQPQSRLPDLQRKVARTLPSTPVRKVSSASSAVATSGSVRREPSGVALDSRNGVPAASVPHPIVTPPVATTLPVSAPSAVLESDARAASLVASAAAAVGTSSPSSSSTEALAALRAQEEQRVRGVLQRYARAYEQLDAKAAKAVWPNVDERALSRAFDGLQSQHIAFDRCELSVKGVDARATCQGTATYIPKIGSKDPRTLRRQWAFALNRAEGDWLIAEAETR